MGNLSLSRWEQILRLPDTAIHAFYWQTSHSRPSARGSRLMSHQQLECDGMVLPKRNYISHSMATITTYCNMEDPRSQCMKEVCSSRLTITYRCKWIIAHGISNSTCASFMRRGGNVIGYCLIGTISSARHLTY